MTVSEDHPNSFRYYCQSAEYVPGFSASDGSGFYTSIDYWDGSKFIQKLRTKKGNFGSYKLMPSDFGLTVGCKLRSSLFIYDARVSRSR